MARSEAQLVECFPGMHEALDSAQHPINGVVAQPYNPSTLIIRELEAQCF